MNPKTKSNPTLPEPDDQAKAHSAELTQRISKQLKRQQELSFAQFMEMALYTPNLGYYTNSLPKIGRQGDFITAPEVSPIFSRCLARQAEQALKQLDTPNLVEFGAGRGVMARDILLELQDYPLTHYYIIELSAHLREIQKQTLSQLPAELLDKVIWLDQLPTKPIEAVVLANEVLDAMPVERLKLEAGQALIAQVIFDDTTQKFDWHYVPITERKLQKFANALLKNIGTPPPKGYKTEINLNIKPWLASLSSFMAKGLVLLVDYGYSRTEYYQPARSMGTLRCHYQHLAHSNPFFYPGLQDITAHVDFTEVAESSFDAGFKVAGYTTQAHFLMGSGLLEMSFAPDAPVTEQIHIAQQIKTLTLPDEMGENFKVIALTKQLDLSLMGFQLRDLRHLL